MGKTISTKTVALLLSFHIVMVITCSAYATTRVIVPIKFQTIPGSSTTVTTTTNSNTTTSPIAGTTATGIKTQTVISSTTSTTTAMVTPTNASTAAAATTPTPVTTASAQSMTSSQPAKEVAEIINPGKSTFTTKLPFDEAFVIKYPVNSSVHHVRFRYGVKDSDLPLIKRYYKDNDFSEGVRRPLGRINFTEDADILNLDNAQNLFIDVGPLRPKTYYRFEFEEFRKIPFTPDQIISVKSQIATAIRETFEDPAKIDKSKIEELTTSLSKITLNSFAGEKIVNLDGSDFKLEAFGPTENPSPLRPISNNVIKWSSGIKTDKDELSKSIGSINTFGDDNIITRLNKIKDILNQLVNEKFYLSEEACILWEMKLGQEVTNGDDITLEQATKLVSTLSKNPGVLAEILKGNKKIKNLKIEVSPEFDENSVRLIKTVLEIVIRNIFTKNDGQLVFNDAAAVNKIQENILLLNSVIDNQKKISLNQKNLDNLAKELPDIYLNVFIERSFAIYEQAFVNNLDEHTVYVSADLGYIGAFNDLKYSDNTKIGQAFYSFAYAGCNIHFKPVNKKADLSKLHFWPRFGKEFSFHFGVATLLGSYGTDRISNLLGNFGNWVIGVGYRPNQVTKFSLNTTWVKVAGTDPVVNRTSIRPLISLGFTLDVNVARAFGPLATKLNLF